MSCVCASRHAYAVVCVRVVSCRVCGVRAEPLFMSIAWTPLGFREAMSVMSEGKREISLVFRERGGLDDDDALGSSRESEVNSLTVTFHRSSPLL